MLSNLYFKKNKLKENHETDKPCLLRLGRDRWRLGIRTKLGTREVGKSLDFIIFFTFKKDNLCV